MPLIWHTLRFLLNIEANPIGNYHAGVFVIIFFGIRASEGGIMGLEDRALDMPYPPTLPHPTWAIPRAIMGGWLQGIARFHTP